MKRIILLGMSILVLILSTGCWDARELNELGISLVMGFDIEDDKVILTAEVIQPIDLDRPSANGDDSYVKYVQGTGNNIFEAFRDIVLKFDRRIFASHTKVLIFGEDFAKRGLIDYIDELYRDREQREMAYILIAKGQKAYEVMGINGGLEDIPANYIVDLIKNVKNNPKTTKIDLIEFLKHYYHKGHHPVAGMVEKDLKTKIDKITQDSNVGMYELSVMGAAIFNEDKLVGYLDGNDTKSLNFITDNITGGIITFPTPDLTNQTGIGINSNKKELSSVIIVNNKTQNDIEIIDGKIILKTKVKLRASIGEIVGNIDISKEENIRAIERDCSKTIEDALRNAVIIVQKDYKIDIFGYGLVFHRKYPREWKDIEKDWDTIFSEAEIKVDVKTNIIRTGLINTPVNQLKGR